jgi:6-phosphogluconolactonase (cycloisomerase 2 family)
MAHNPNNRFVIVALRWAVLALGLAFSALNTGCGGGGGGSTSTALPRQGAGSNYLYLATADAGGVVAQSKISGVVGSTLAPANVASAKSPSGVIASPGGHFVYVADTATGSVYQYSIASTGVLLPLTPSRVAIGASGGSMSIAEDGAGRSVYAVSTSSMAVLTVGSDGSLSLKSSIATSGPPMALAAAGESVFATIFNQSGNSLIAYHVASDGSLTQTSAVALSGASVWDGLATDPLGRAIYVLREGAGGGTGSIMAFAVDAGGTLTSMGAPVEGGNPSAGVVDAAASTLYVLDGVEVRTFSLAGGSLAEMPNVLLPVATPQGIQAPFTPTSPAFSTAQVLIDPGNSCVYTSGVGSSVFAVPLGSGGAPSTTPVAVESTINPAGGAAIAD